MPPHEYLIHDSRFISMALIVKPLRGIACMRSPSQIWFSRIAAVCVLGLFFVWPIVASAIVLVWLVYSVGAATWYQGCLGPSLERGLGFEHGKLYQRVGRRLCSA